MLDNDGCPQFRSVMGRSRREILSIGIAAGMGLSLASLLKVRAAAGAESPTVAAKSLILIYLHGGHPQHETWDLVIGKPITGILRNV